VLLCATAIHAQWTIQDAHTTADLRGIHALGNGVAWASGTEGTVLRTTNDGKDWQRCTTPPDADHLDFRGIQAFDASIAIVMSIGKGPLSRLYKTIDACQTWKLLFTNPDPEGFWDTVRAVDDDVVEIVGDSVDRVLVSEKIGHIVPVWRFNQGDDPDDRASDHFVELAADPGEGAFAASNSILAIGSVPHRDPIWSYQWLATQTAEHSYIHREATEQTPTCEPCRVGFVRTETPMSQGVATAGIFSLQFREDRYGVAVGGDYTKPNNAIRTAAYSDDTGANWTLAQTQPHGFRSAVAYDPTTKTWITVGPNGTDISTDDGRDWRPLRPSSTDAPDADQHWNALSLPFVVGPHGRIGKLNPQALSTGH